MLVFIDESGDLGQGLKAGSSQFFVMAAVIFPNQVASIECSQRIDRIKDRLKWHQSSEFHFYHNSNKIRHTFLECVARSNFTYNAVIVNKQLLVDKLDYQDLYYMLIQDIEPKGDKLTIILDEGGDLLAKKRLARYFKSTEANKVILQRSSANNLIQLADYVAAILNRSAEGKKHGNEYRAILSKKEGSVIIWPK